MSDFFDTIGKRISDTVDDLGKKAGDTIDIQKKKNEIYAIRGNCEAEVDQMVLDDWYMSVSNRGKW